MTSNLEVSLLLEEYRALRAEVSGSLQAQHAALSYGVAALALFIVGVSSAWDKSAALTGVGLMIGLPIGIAFVLTIWSTEVSRMKRAGAYMCDYLEPRIDLSTPGLDHPLAYERWLSYKEPPRRKGAKPRSLRAGHTLVVSILALMSLTAFTVGAVRFDAAAKQARHCVTARGTAANVACGRPVPGPSSKGSTRSFHAAREFRWWHVGWPTAWSGLLGDGELFAAFLVAIVIPAGLALRMLFQDRRQFSAADLPAIPSRTPATT
jgi:hypothetical protein